MSFHYCMIMTVFELKLTTCNANGKCINKKYASVCVCACVCVCVLSDSMTFNVCMQQHYVQCISSCVYINKSEQKFPLWEYGKCRKIKYHASNHIWNHLKKKILKQHISSLAFLRTSHKNWKRKKASIFPTNYWSANGMVAFIHLTGSSYHNPYSNTIHCIRKRRNSEKRLAVCKCLCVCNELFPISHLHMCMRAFDAVSEKWKIEGKSAYRAWLNTQFVSLVCYHFPVSLPTLVWADGLYASCWFHQQTVDKHWVTYEKPSWFS